MNPQLKFKSLVILISWAGIVSNARTGQTLPHAFSLRITTPNQVVRAGSEVNVEVAITNESDSRIYFSWEVSPIKMQVLNSDGKAVSVIPKVKKASRLPPPKPGEARPGPGGSYSSAKIDPGSTTHLNYGVTREFDLSQPGKYTLQATREVDGNVVKSNTITITP
jgi:hypothetical protein